MSLLVTELQIQIADYSTLTIGAFRYEEMLYCLAPYQQTLLHVSDTVLRSSSTLSSMSERGTGMLVFLSSSVELTKDVAKPATLAATSAQKL